MMLCHWGVVTSISRDHSVFLFMVTFHEKPMLDTEDEATMIFEML
jgi:hypothetical protein